MLEKRKYTVVSWDGKPLVFERATQEVKNGEYIIQDLDKHETFYVFPQANVLYIKEELCEEDE